MRNAPIKREYIYFYLVVDYIAQILLMHNKQMTCMEKNILEN